MPSNMNDQQFAKWMKAHNYTHTEALAISPGHTVYRDEVPLATVIYFDGMLRRNIYIHA